jgi:hypothetical protein
MSCFALRNSPALVEAAKNSDLTTVQVREPALLLFVGCGADPQSSLMHSLCLEVLSSPLLFQKLLENRADASERDQCALVNPLFVPSPRRSGSANAL